MVAYRLQALRLAHRRAAFLAFSTFLKGAFHRLSMGYIAWAVQTVWGCVPKRLPARFGANRSRFGKGGRFLWRFACRRMLRGPCFARPPICAQIPANPAAPYAVSLWHPEAYAPGAFRELKTAGADPHAAIAVAPDI